MVVLVSYFTMLIEGGEKVFVSTDLALKSAQIVDFCGKSSGFADFENTVDRGSWIVDRGSTVNFGADSGLCLSSCLDLGS